jgi:hypothetical protein
MVYALTIRMGRTYKATSSMWLIYPEDSILLLPPWKFIHSLPFKIYFGIFFFFFFSVLRFAVLRLGLHPALLVMVFFQDTVLWTICLSWLWTAILLICSLSSKGLSHWHLALSWYFWFSSRQFKGIFGYPKYKNMSVYYKKTAHTELLKLKWIFS